MQKKNKIVHEFDTQNKKYDCWLDIDYYINEEEKIVVCKITPGFDRCPLCIDDVHTKANIARNFYNWCLESGKEFIGRAKCVDPDVFNVDTGKRIAYDRAIIKMTSAQRVHYERFAKFVQEDIDWMNELAKEATEYATKVNQRLDQRLEDIEKGE